MRTGLKWCQVFLVDTKCLGLITALEFIVGFLQQQIEFCVIGHCVYANECGTVCEWIWVTWAVLFLLIGSTIISSQPAWCSLVVTTCCSKWVICLYNIRSCLKEGICIFATTVELFFNLYPALFFLWISPRWSYTHSWRRWLIYYEGCKHEKWRCYAPFIIKFQHDKPGRMGACATSCSLISEWEQANLTLPVLAIPKCTGYSQVYSCSQRSSTLSRSICIPHSRSCTATWVVTADRYDCSWLDPTHQYNYKGGETTLPYWLCL